MGYLPQLEQSTASCWLLAPVEAAPPAGARFDDASLDAMDGVQRTRHPGTLPVGAHQVLVLPGQSAHASLVKHFGSPVGQGRLPGLLVLLSGDEDSVELLTDNPAGWRRTEARLELPSGQVCLADPLAPWPAGGPQRLFTLPGGSYAVYEFEQGTARAVYLQRE